MNGGLALTPELARQIPAVVWQMFVVMRVDETCHPVACASSSGRLRTGYLLRPDCGGIMQFAGVSTGSATPRTTPAASRTAPAVSRAARDVSRTAQDTSRTAQDESRTTQDMSRTAQDVSRSAQDGPCCFWRKSNERPGTAAGTFGRGVEGTTGQSFDLLRMTKCFMNDSPGIIFTPLAKDELNGPRSEGYRRMIALSPAGRGGTPDEVGAVAALLMGPDGTFITGSDFLMDGGVTAAYWFGDLAPK